EAYERGDFWNRLRKVGPVLLDHAAADDQPLDALPLALGNFEDGVDRLLFGGVDEAARVHDDDVGLIEVVRDRDVRFLAELTEHDLGVDEVFRAAQGDHPHAPGRLLFSDFTHGQPFNTLAR